MAVRLSKQKWCEIKRQYVAGRTAKDLAQQFGITVWTIHRRSSAERWRNEIPVSVAQMTDRPAVGIEIQAAKEGA